MGSLERAIWDQNTSEATFTDGTDYRQESRPWHTVIKKSLDESRPLYYEAEGKFISFKPVSISSEKTQPTLSTKETDLVFEGVWPDAALIVELSRDHWKKLIRIDRAPITVAEYVDYVFEVETDFKIDTRQEHVRLGEFTSMEVTQAWDSTPREQGVDKKGEPYDTENKIKIQVVWTLSSGKLYMTKRIPTEWLSKAVFPVYTDVDISWGTASEFESGDVFSGYWAPFISVASIGDNKFVVAYCDDADYDAGKARVGTVSGTTITWGDISEFCADIGIGRSAGVCKLGTDKFVVVYADDRLAGADDGYARVGTVSGTTISWGTAEEFETGHTEQPNCTQLGTDKFAIVYNDERNSDTWTVCVCTVSGTTITSGTPATLVAGDVYNMYQPAGICKLDTDKFAVMVSDDAEDGMVYAVSVSGTTCTVGTGVEIEDAGASACSLAQLGTDKFVAVWNENGNIRTNVCTVSGTTITKGTEQDSGYNTHTGGSAYGATLGVTQVDTDKFIIVFMDADDSEKGKSTYCTVSGTTVTFGSRELFHDAATDIPAVCVLTNPAVAVAAYCDDADASDHGEAIAGTLPSGATAKSGSDSGSGAEASGLTVNLSRVDTGTGADSPVLSALLGKLDTGQGIELSSLLAALTKQESGSGVELSSLLGLLTGTEAGTGVDLSQFSLKDLFGLDSGSGVDSILQTLAALSAIDSALGTDLAEKFIELLAKYASESGTGSDVSSLVASLSKLDSGSGIDLSLLISSFLRTDSGTGVDLSTLVGVIVALDTGQGADLAALLASYQGKDIGTGQETLLSRVLGLSDSGIGVDSAISLAVILTGLDSALGTDLAEKFIDILNKFASDSGVGVDIALAQLASLVASDLATGEEHFIREGDWVEGELVIGRGFVLPEVTTSAEIALHEAILSALDSGTGTELAQLLAELGAIDSALATELADRYMEIVNLQATDLGVGQEVSVLLANIVKVDAGIGSELSHFILKELLKKDVGFGTDTVLHLLASLTKVDSALGTDIVTYFLATTAKYADDSGVGIDEVISHLASLSSVDTGLGADLAATTLREFFRQDAGVVSDVSSLLASLFRTDSGAGLDTLVMVAYTLQSTDSGAGVDVSKLSAFLEALDSGSGVELAKITLKAMIASDSSLGTDEKVTLIAALFGTDEAIGSDLAMLHRIGQLLRMLLYMRPYRDMKLTTRPYRDMELYMRPYRDMKLTFGGKP